MPVHSKSTCPGAALSQGPHHHLARLCCSAFVQMFPWLECLGFLPFCSALQSFAWHLNTVCQILLSFFIHSRLHWDTGWKCNQEILFFDLNRKTLEKFTYKDSLWERNEAFGYPSAVQGLGWKLVEFLWNWVNYTRYILQSQVLTTSPKSCLTLSPMIQSCLQIITFI